METLSILIAGFIGFLTYKLVSYNITGKDKAYSPKEFDPIYFICDRNNWNDALLGLLLLGLITFFKNDIFLAFPTNFLIVFLQPFKENLFLYVIVGFKMSFIIKIIRVAVSKLDKQSKKK